MADIGDPYFDPTLRLRMLQMMLESDPLALDTLATLDPAVALEQGLDPGACDPGQLGRIPTAESSFAAYQAQLYDPQIQQLLQRTQSFDETGEPVPETQPDQPQAETGDPLDLSEGTHGYANIDSDVYGGAWDGLTIRDENGKPLLTDASAVGAGIDMEAGIGGHAEAEWAGFEAGVGGGLEATATAGGWAAGTADLSEGDFAGALHGGAFAGGMANGNAELGVRYAHADVTAGVGVGWGADGGVHAGLEDWKLKAGFDLKLGAGLAFEFSPDVEIDLKQIGSDVVDAGKAIGNAASSAWNWVSGGDGGKPKDDSLD